MDTQIKARFKKDLANRKITVVKELDTDLTNAWSAFTDPKLLDRWWAPKPYKAITKEWNFKEGGRWLYAMTDPKGKKQWAKLDFRRIDAPRQFTGVDAFTDETGKSIDNMPTAKWSYSFKKKDAGTEVTIELTFDSQEDMKKLLDTGFEEGFQMGLGNLDELLAE